jgi:hypothetical protein
VDGTDLTLLSLLSLRPIRLCRSVSLLLHALQPPSQCEMPISFSRRKEGEARKAVSDSDCGWHGWRGAQGKARKEGEARKDSEADCGWHGWRGAQGKARKEGEARKDSEADCGGHGWRG